MTDTTDINALRPSERAKLGFVTDDNTGGYYVAECKECGKIFPSQTCDGGEQIADSGDYGDCYCPHCGFIDPLECDNANLVWNVQQLKIVNLTKQLEAERQRADELSERQSKNGVGKLQSEVIRLRIENAALKSKLANPVVLHNERDDYQDTDEYEQGYVRGYNASRRNSVADIEKAGFTVKGE